MPPVRMTKVIPIDTMPVTTDWSSRFKRLLVLRKCGESSDSAIAMTIASASMRNSSGADRMLKRRGAARPPSEAVFGAVTLIGAWRFCS